MTRRIPGTLIALTATLMLVTAACGSNNDKTDASSPDTTVAAKSAGGTDASAAKERVTAYLDQPATIGITAPLSAKPPAGKKVYWLEGNIQSILPITQGFKDATKALGWNLTVLTYDPSDPQGAGSAMRQAVDAGADFIAISGQPVSVMGAALDAAKAKNIPVIDMFTTDDPKGAANGIYANVGGVDSSKKSAQILTDYTISDSGGDANVLFVNLPDFPILHIVADAVTGAFQSNCKQCSVTPLNVSIADLTSGAVASNIVSKLQANPKIDYVYVSIGDLASGLPQALDGAGLGGKVKIVGGVPNKEQVQSLIDAKATAYTLLGRPAAAWTATDVMVRLALGMDPDLAEHSQLPTWVWTPGNVPKPAQEFDGPKDYQSQFTKLWSAA